MIAILRMGILRGELEIKDIRPNLYLAISEKLPIAVDDTPATFDHLRKIEFVYSKRLSQNKVEYEFNKIM
jgi:hypothetical protein